VPSKRLRAFGHFFGNSAGTGNHGVDGLNGNDQISKRVESCDLLAGIRGAAPCFSVRTTLLFLFLQGETDSLQPASTAT
jgi:hypothetical protein